MSEKRRIKSQKTQSTQPIFYTNDTYDKKWGKIKEIVKCKISNYQTIQSSASKKLTIVRTSKRVRSYSSKSFFQQSKKLFQDETFRKRSQKSLFKLPNNNFIAPIQNQNTKNQPVKQTILDKIHKKITIQRKQPQLQGQNKQKRQNKNLQSKQKVVDVKLDLQRQNIASGSIFNLQELTNNLNYIPSLQSEKHQQSIVKNNLNQKNQHSQAVTIEQRKIKVKQVDVQTDWVNINQMMKNTKTQKIKSSNKKQEQIEEIQEITLQKSNKFKRQIKQPQQTKNAVNNNLLEMKKPIKSKQQTTKDQGNRIESNKVKKIQNKEEKQENELNLEALKQQIKKNQIMLDSLLPLGQVAGYCSKLMKKSKLNWQLPSLLLYKQLYRHFKASQDITRTAHNHNIVTKSSMDLFVQQNNQLKLNLQKIIRSSQKNKKIPQKYLSFVNPLQNHPLSVYIYEQVIKISNYFVDSDEKDDSNTALCILRMLQCTCILMKMNGIKKIPKIINIEELQDAQVQQLLPELLVIVKQKNKCL